ncbi:MAG TPA: hypothetical protein VFF65_04070 [Phycisphaerales bacterium]|nr:hypothetical protein [Phycisphaerales bacterium]
MAWPAQTYSPSNGGVIEPTSLETDLNAWRGYVNGGFVFGDLDAADLPGSQAILKPDVLPYPTNAQIGEFQEFHWPERETWTDAEFSRDGSSVEVAVRHTGNATRRWSFFPEQCYPNGTAEQGIIDPTFPLPYLGRRITLEVAALLEVRATFGITVRHTLAAAGQYGVFRLCYQAVTTASATVVSGTLRFMQVGVTKPYTLATQLELAAGTYDVWVEWYLGSDNPTGIKQVIVQEPTLAIEVFK